MAMMSGRGVITSRTMVSVKSTIDCSSSRPSASEIAPSASDSPSPAFSSLASAAPPPLAASRSRPDHADHCGGHRPQRPDDGVKHREQDVEDRFRIAPDDQHRQHVLADHYE